jgi:hypothetical protein
MKLHLLNFRVSFANGLYKASAFEPGQQEKFGADFIEQSDSVVMRVNPDGTKTKTTLKDAELAVATEAWKANAAKVLSTLEPSKKSLRDGSKRVNSSGDAYEGYEGHWYVTAKSPTRPLLIDQARQPVTEEDGVIYSGCYVNAIVEFYANAQAGKKGVFAQLKGVQFVRDGDSFGGGAPAKADEFDAVEGADAGDFA